MADKKPYFVLKCGGSTLAELPDAFFIELKGLVDHGYQPIIVHGGGPAINQTLERLGIQSTFFDGLRRTDEATLGVVEMVLSGKINKEVVSRIQQHGARAIGLSGVDGLLLETRPVANADRLGFVGEVIAVNVGLLQGITEMGYIPVIAPVGIDRLGQRYNINADTAAGTVASQLGVQKMVVVTDVPGIMQTNGEENAVLSEATFSHIEAMIASGEIYGGMIPKVKAAMQCIQGEVQAVSIISGFEPEALSKAVQLGSGGTKIIKSKEMTGVQDQ